MIVLLLKYFNNKNHLEWKFNNIYLLGKTIIKKIIINYYNNNRIKFYSNHD